MKAERYMLEKSVRALKNSPFPSGPDRETAEATLAALAEASGQTYEAVTKKRTIMERMRIVKPYVKFALAAMIVVAALIGIYYAAAASMVQRRLCSSA